MASVASMPQATLLPGCHRRHSAGRRVVKCQVQWQQVGSVGSTWRQTRARARGQWVCVAIRHCRAHRAGQEPASGGEVDSPQDSERWTRGTHRPQPSTAGTRITSNPLSVQPGVSGQGGADRRVGLPSIPAPWSQHWLLHTYRGFPISAPDCSQPCWSPQSPTCPTSLG